MFIRSSIFFSFACGLLFCLMGCGRAVRPVPGPAPLREKDVAAEQVKALREGVLLVRLPTRSRSEEALRLLRRDDWADSLAVQMSREHRQIVAAFERHFDFCPVYYFYGSCSDTLRNGLARQCLRNADLQPDTTVHLREGYWFVAEFASTEGAIGMNTLVVRDNHFLPLGRPFPYKVAVRSAYTPLPRGREKSVRVLNQRLHRFYRKAR